MPTAGSLIWTSIVPLLKISASVVAGFWLTKKGLFPPAASRGFSQVTMNLALPCLIFSSIVPSFNSSNIANIGPLLLTAFFYQITGLLMGLIVREIFWVPKEFHWGILIMSSLSNWGNLPTAIVQSVAAGEPFDSATDPTLGVGFVAVFILCYNLSFFTGVYKICAWDFLDLEPEGPREGFLAKWTRRRRWFDAKLGRDGGRKRKDSSSGAEDAVEREDGTGLSLPELERVPSSKAERLEGGKERDSKVESSSTAVGMGTLAPRKDPKTRRVSFGQQQQQNQQQLAAMERLTRQTSAATVESVLPNTSNTMPSFLPTFHSSSSSSSSSSNPSPNSPSRTIPSTVAHQLPPPHDSESNLPPSSPEPQTPTKALTSTPPPSEKGPRTILGGMKAAAESIFTPITLSLLAAIIIALVPPLKALFVPNVEGWTGTKIKLAPDGRPALAFIQETAVFIGAICVPGALILLGASFARLKVPKTWSALPIGAMLATTATKLVILPIIGVSFVQGLSAHTSLYPKEDKILSFVGMLLSGSPAAVNQLVVTNLVAPEGKTDTIAAFLLFQYVFFFFSSTALTAVSLLFVS
ncbi:auxin efflux carrier [Mrakia frigida]|uniref:auxin efflux carrier n=1 Tax=Mrakia frigida TaxID=29902 RepID=UPI003FCC0A95